MAAIPSIDNQILLDFELEVPHSNMVLLCQGPMATRAPRLQSKGKIQTSQNNIYELKESKWLIIETVEDVIN